MKIEMEATDQIVTIHGVRGRIWKGTTETGQECLVFVHRIMVPIGDDQAAFEKTLVEMLPPGVVTDLRMLT